MASIFLRTILIYFILLVSIRLMGKRQVGELEVSELVTTFLLSELAVIPITNSSTSILHAVVPILLLLSAEVILSYVTSKNSVVRQLVIGKPSVIIKRGKLDMKELKKLRMSVPELMSELRLKGASTLSEVDYAIVEGNGQLSVFKCEGASPVTTDDMGIKPTRRGIAHCVIVDGKFYDEGLSSVGHDRAWAEDTARARGAKIDDICVMTVDDGDEVIIIRKEEKQ
ncbi:MAG: DUF421 domain-containing protein [Clostridia bacterium]|nr:DUF421 domain-containing protein [Clostridia bacterium]